MMTFYPKNLFEVLHLRVSFRCSIIELILHMMNIHVLLSDLLSRTAFLECNLRHQLHIREWISLESLINANKADGSAQTKYLQYESVRVPSRTNYKPSIKEGLCGNSISFMCLISCVLVVLFFLYCNILTEISTPTHTILFFAPVDRHPP